MLGVLGVLGCYRARQHRPVATLPWISPGRSARVAWVRAQLADEEVEEPPAHESEKKRFYSLTRIGRGILTAETNRLATLVRAARSRLKRTGAVS